MINVLMAEESRESDMKERGGAEAGLLKTRQNMCGSLFLKMFKSNN